jgi:trimeric autotransporter adhesin
MTSNSTAGALRRSSTLLPFAAFVLAAATASALAIGVAHAAPPAGTSIGNQASASYLDASSTSRTVTSNLVTTIVQQVAGLTLTADGAALAAPGGQVVFPHVLTNDGNGPDTFPLTLVNLAGDDFDLAGLALYPDADGNGVPDNYTPIASSGVLAAGASFRFVVAGNVPGAQLATDVAQVRVTATSAFDGGETAFNTDVTTVTGNAVLNVTKAISLPNGASPSGPYTYTIAYTNAGNSVATAAVLSDVIPAGMTYRPGTGRWSTTGAAVLTDLGSADAQGTAPNTIVYDYGVTGGGTVTATINRVAPGASGTLTFEVDVDAGLAPQTINNVATFAYNDGVGPVGPFPTNVAPFTVDAAASVTFVGQVVAAATQGATIAYSNVLTNTGNATDVFDIVVGASTFPAGTTYVLFRADGVTPLTDSDGNFIPDTGPLAAGAATTIVLRVSLPPSATGGPFQVQKTATSLSDPGQFATATDVLTSITASTVDVTNNAPLPGGLGAGAGPEGSAVVSLPATPGSTVRYTLYVNNTSSGPDNYDVAASTDGTFSSLALPAGWSVVFRDGSNAILTNTGSIAAGGSVLVHADVTVAANYAPGSVSLYFQARSSVSGADDVIHDAVDVQTVRSLQIVPNNSAQVIPGGTVLYSHMLINAGNVTEGDGLGSFVSVSQGNNQAGWNAALYWDTNGSGVFDAGDLPLTDLVPMSGLAPGATVRIFAQVFAPAGAALGQVNTTSITAGTVNLAYTTTVPGPATATDVTTVINGQLQLVKRQVLDVACDGIPDGAYDVIDITTGAIPGACLRYEIVVTNVGTTPVTSVVVSDGTPANTTYSNAVPASTTQGTIVTPANGAAGSITANVGTLAPGQSATITVGIRIDP